MPCYAKQQLRLCCYAYIPADNRPLCAYLCFLCFLQGMDEGGLDYALNRCIDAYYNDRAWFRSLQARIMRQDWSWNRPAIDYVELYYSATKN